MTSQQSVLLVGGGHNGLVCAAYLAKAGMKVQVLESRQTAGGGASTYEFSKGYKSSGLAHILTAINPKVCKDLGLDAAGLNPGQPIDTISLQPDGRHLTLRHNEILGEGLSAQDQSAYTRFKENFRAYAQALEPLMTNKPPRLKDMDGTDKFTLAKLGWKLRFGLGADAMSEFLRVGGINIYDVLSEEFTDPRIGGALSVDAVLGHHMGPRTPGTVLTYLHRLRSELHGSQSLPSGGMGHITDVLTKAATGFGASLRTGAHVRKILVQNNRATGVELDSGETITADLVISNADAKTTFLELVGTAELDAMFSHRISKTRTNGNVARINLALRQLPEFSGLSTEQLGHRLLVAPTARYVEQAFNYAKYGEYSPHPILEMVIPSIADPALTPQGHHVMSVSASFAPYGLTPGWEQQGDKFLQQTLQQIETYAPGFSDLVVGSELLTPKDIERQYHISGGHWHHGEMNIDQAFMMRPVHGSAQYNTPIDGLFLCGAAAHPGGGINGNAGHNAAQRILAMSRGATS